MVEPRLNAYVSNFQADHRELNRLLRDTDRALQTCESNDWSPATRQILCDALADLSQRLERHFAQEEEGGYLEEALIAAPWMTPAAADLLTEHPLVLSQLAELREKAKLCREHNQADRSRLCEAYLALRAMLLEHEKSENALVQKAYNVSFEAE